MFFTLILATGARSDEFIYSQFTDSMERNEFGIVIGTVRYGYIDENFTYTERR